MVPSHPVDAERGADALPILDGRAVYRGAQRTGRGVPGRASDRVPHLGPPEATARNLPVHCGQEMNHLAGFLAELYDVFGDEKRLCVWPGALLPRI